MTNNLCKFVIASMNLKNDKFISKNSTELSGFQH